ncbi:hypothetical protein Trydic_g6997 [Trypoxylus dichotomus]
MVEHIKESFNLGEYTGAVFLDLAKAFDTVWYQQLLLKMRLIHSYHRQRAFKVKLEAQQFTDRTITAGASSREKHARALLKNRSQKKKARQYSRAHLPRRHNPLVTSNQTCRGHTGFPSELGTSRHRSRTTDVCLSATDRAKQARFLISNVARSSGVRRNEFKRRETRASTKDDEKREIRGIGGGKPAREIKNAFGPMQTCRWEDKRSIFLALTQSRNPAMKTGLFWCP